MGKYLDAAKKVRPYIEKGVQSLTEAEAMEAATLYPAWADLVERGTVEAAEGFKFRGPDGTLFKCREENPKFQKDWLPGLSTNALYVRIGEESEAGTAARPIAAARGMEYIYGKYYTDPEDGKLYICHRINEADGGTIVLQYLPHELVGAYFEVASE